MRSRRHLPARAAHLLRLSLIAAVAAGACTRENITGVVVQGIDVLPPTVSVQRDESVQLVAQVRDVEGHLLQTANVTWSSDRPSVVSVSPGGLVTAVGVGPATVRASAGGAEGVAHVVVTAPKLLHAEPESVTLRAAVGFGTPGAVHVDIRDDGQEVEDLEASVAYPAGSEDGWLEARLHDDDSPTKLDVSAETSGMPAGVYTASVLVWGADTRDTPVEISVTMTVAGLAVRETDGRTLVSGSGGSDQVMVELLLRPERDVVLRVRSRDTEVAVVSPEEIRFTPGDWNAPRALTITAGGGGGWWGYDSTEIAITVEKAASDPMYEPLGETTVTATVFRSPFR